VVASEGLTFGTVLERAGAAGCAGRVVIDPDATDWLSASSFIAAGGAIATRAGPRTAGRSPGAPEFKAPPRSVLLLTCVPSVAVDSVAGAISGTTRLAGARGTACAGADLPAAGIKAGGSIPVGMVAKLLDWVRDRGSWGGREDVLVVAELGFRPASARDAGRDIADSGRDAGLEVSEFLRPRYLRVVGVNGRRNLGSND
jgi:hypothetical protein